MQQLVYHFTMKNFLVAILALLYISSSMGANVHMHSCMGQLAGWGFIQHSSKTCAQCGMERSRQKNKNCCKDESKFFKSQTDQEATVSVLSLIQPVTVALPVSFFEIPSVDIFAVKGKNPTSHAPPRGSGIAVYIRNCVFLI